MPPSWRKRLLARLVAPQVADRQLEAGHDEGRLAGPGDELVVAERGFLGEDLPVRPEPDAGAGDALLHPRALAGQARLGGVRRAGAVAVEDARVPALERHALDGRAALDVDVEAGREGVDHRGADAVQSARRDVRAAAELPAGVQLGEDHLDTGQPRLGLLVDRDAAAVVVHLDGPVRVEGDLDPLRGTGERLVDPVVDDLPDAVHEPAGVGGADVHARSLADRLETLQDQEVTSVVRVVDGASLVSHGAAGWHGSPREGAIWCCSRIYSRHAVRADSPRLLGAGRTPRDHESLPRHVTKRQRVVSSLVDWQRLGGKPRQTCRRTACVGEVTRSHG